MGRGCYLNVEVGDVEGGYPLGELAALVCNRTADLRKKPEGVPRLRLDGGGIEHTSCHPGYCHTNILYLHFHGPICILVIHHLLTSTNEAAIDYR